jgi:3'-phosphoadenosine 5'-phosphosulfate sulfotransferase (PAPS reductase)/FAD synthetase
MTIVINFSGGKDSSAMLSYICENWPTANKVCIMADTGWEHKDAIEWSRKICAMHGLKLNVCRNPNKTFLTMAKNRGMFPGMQTRQCTSDLKRGPIQTWIRRNVNDNLIVNATGMRAEESTGRAKLKVLSRDKTMTNSKRTVWNWNPIHKWSENRVRAYLMEKGIPLHPVYNHLKRFSCRMCIYMTNHDRNQVAIHDPEAIEIIHSIEKQIGFTMFMDGPVK